MKYLNQYTYKINEIVPINAKLNFIVGSSGSGKTRFMKTLLEHVLYTNIYIYCQDPKEWDDTKYKDMQISVENPIANIDIFETKIQNNSLVVIDDYFHTEGKDINNNFRKIICYLLRHNSITLIINVHTFIRNNLYSFFILAENIFFTYSKINKRTLFYLYLNFGLDFRSYFEKFYLEGHENYNIGYINSKNNYCIPYVDQLFLKSNFPQKMFKDNQEFLIFLKDDLSIKEEYKDNNEDDIFQKLVDLIRDIYPKNPKILTLTKILFNHLKEYINQETLFIEINEKRVNFLDFVKNTQSLNIGKNMLDKKTIFILNYMKNKNIKIAKLLIKNKNIQKYLCE